MLNDYLYMHLVFHLINEIGPWLNENSWWVVFVKLRNYVNDYIMMIWIMQVFNMHTNLEMESFFELDWEIWNVEIQIMLCRFYCVCVCVCVIFTWTIDMRVWVCRKITMVKSWRIKAKPMCKLWLLGFDLLKIFEPHCYVF